MPHREPANTKDSQVVLAGLLRIGDAVVVVGMGVLTYWLRQPESGLPVQYMAAIAGAALLCVNYMQISGAYRQPDLGNATAQIRKTAAGWGAVVLTLLALAFFTKTSAIYSRLWLISWALLCFGGMLALRLFVLWLIGRWTRAGDMHVNVAIVGAGEHGRRLAHHLSALPDSSYRVVGLFDERDTRVPQTIEGFPVLGTVDDLVTYSRSHPLDEIVIALPWGATGRLLGIVKKLKIIPINVRLSPEITSFQIPVRGFGSMAGLPMLDLFERPLSGWNLALKAIEDRVFAAIALALIAPLLLVIVIAIKLENRGPALFRQRRYGFNSNEFTVYKFRTMRQGAENDSIVPQARVNDPRVTRVGSVLRRTSLDELPQLINVLKGDMSLVGPRPHAVVHNEKYSEIIDDYLSRHRVKPGITGWAQVNGLRGETDTPEKMRLRVQHDLYYIENWSLLFDLKILMLTLFVGFVHKNAY